MKRRLYRWTGFFAIMLGVTTCAGGPDLATIQPPEPDSAISLVSILEAEQTWQRTLHPESNSVFRMIDGVYYYRLNPGDDIELTLSLENGPSTLPLRIGPAGEIRLPGYLVSTPVTLGGLTIPEAEDRLADALSNSLRRPYPTVRITAYRGAYVSLMGEIVARSNISTAEGRYALEGRTTLRDFIFTHFTLGENADPSAIVITDASGRSGIFDLTASVYSFDESQNPVLDKGDIILVPSTAITQHRIFVLGEVARQSMLQPHSNMTILDAIAEAGGLTIKARQKWITLVRGRGVDAELYKIPYRDIVKRGNMTWNVSLKPGDIIHVGRSTYDSTITFFRDTWTILQAGVIATILIDNLKK